MLFLAGLLLGPALVAQPVGQAREFRFPFFSQNKQTGLLTGTGARTQPNGTVVLETARVEHYDPRGNTNNSLLVLATNCTVDLRQSRVSSPAGLRVSTVDGQLVLEGVGFTWAQNDNDLVVSNQVRTTVRKTPAAAGGSLAIQAGSLRFNPAANVVVFEGGVVADDPEIEVRCRRLTVRRGASDRFDRLLAEEAVVLRSRRDGSEATSERAEYRLAETGETIELTGRPRWSDAQREARADTFRLERGGRGTAQTLFAIGQAQLRLPAGTNGLSGWSLLTPPAAPVAPVGATTEPPEGFLELTGGALILVLPPTNGPVRGVVMETNVVIRDGAGAWQAEARRVVFTNDVLELTGDPVWSAGGREVRGDLLRLHTLERGVDVEGRAQLRLPLQTLGNQVPGLAGDAASAPAMTNLVLAVASAGARFREGRLAFEPPVEARLLDGGETLGWLTCRDLSVTYPGWLEAVEAAGDVRLGQPPRRGRPPLARTFTCERMRLEFAGSGLLHRLVADGGVEAGQTETPRPDHPAVVTRVRADRVEAVFEAGTNRLDTATATGRVRVDRDGRRAEAGEARYREASGELVLTGDPVVTVPDGRVADARTLTWDTRQARVRGQGAFRIEWTRVPSNSMPALLSRPGEP